MASPIRSVGAYKLPPVGERSIRLISAVIRRAEIDRAADLVQEAWVAHLAGENPLRRVWRIDRADRRRMKRERLMPDADLSPQSIRERW